MEKKTTAKESYWKSLFKQYLAPAGLGVIIGVVGALSTTLPKIFDYTKKIAAEKRKLKLIESDISAYSKVFEGFKNVLSNDEMKRLFPEDAKTLYIYDRPSGSDDDRLSVSLKQSKEGAFFLWTESSYNSELSGAIFGKWLTRSEATIWAQTYIPVSEFRRLFDPEDLNYMDTTIKMSLY